MIHANVQIAFYTNYCIEIAHRKYKYLRKHFPFIFLDLKIQCSIGNFLTNKKNGGDGGRYIFKKKRIYFRLKNWCLMFLKIKLQNNTSSTTLKTVPQH